MRSKHLSPFFKAPPLCKHFLLAHSQMNMWNKSHGLLKPSTWVLFLCAGFVSWVCTKGWATVFFLFLNIITSLQPPSFSTCRAKWKFKPATLRSWFFHPVTSCGRCPPAVANKAIDRVIWAPFPFWHFLMLNTTVINKLPAFLSVPPHPHYPPPTACFPLSSHAAARMLPPPLLAFI